MNPDEEYEKMVGTSVYDWVSDEENLVKKFVKDILKRQFSKSKMK